MNCCNNGIFLGCFDVCSDVDTGLLAAENGVYTLEIYFMSIKIKKDLTLAIGNKIEVPKNLLNENSEFDLKIKAPSGFLENSYTFKTIPCIKVS